MNNIKLLFLFIILVLLQVLILNHIFFLGYATPFLYIFFIIKLPITFSKNTVILLGFLIGITIDFFSYSPGLNAAATTFAAFLRHPIQRLFFDKEEFEHVESRLSTLGSSFIKYTLTMILVHHVSLISLEYFSYFNFQTILIRVVSSSILTFIIIFAIEGFSIKRNKT